MNEKENMGSEEPFDLPQELLDAGERVRNLAKSDAPPGLAERTLARAAEALPTAKEERAVETAKATAKTTEGIQERRPLSWWLQPVTHPAARIAATVLLLATLGIFAHLDTAERVGRMTEKVIGQKTTDQLYNFVDRMLLAYGPVKIKEKDLDRLVGGHGAAKVNMRPLVPVRGHESTSILRHPVRV